MRSPLLFTLLMISTSACAQTPAQVSGQPFRVATDSVPRAEIVGTVLRAHGGAKGTLFMCHGFHRSMWDFRGYDWIAEQEGDLRRNGRIPHLLESDQ